LERGKLVGKVFRKPGGEKNKKNRGIREKITEEEKKGQKLGTVWRGGR
jgi:hypothetical protein